MDEATSINLETKSFFKTFTIELREGSYGYSLFMIAYFIKSLLSNVGNLHCVQIII